MIYVACHAYGTLLCYAAAIRHVFTAHEQKHARVKCDRATAMRPDLSAKVEVSSFSIGTLLEAFVNLLQELSLKLK